MPRSCLSLACPVFFSVWGTIIGSYRDKLASGSRDISSLCTGNTVEAEINKLL